MRKHILVIVVMLLVAACRPSAEEQATMTATALTATAASWTKIPTITYTPTSTFTNTPTPTKTPDPSRYFSPDNTFSFAILEGWEEEDVDFANLALIGPEVGGYNVSLVFMQEESTFPVAFYAAIVQDSWAGKIQNFNQISEDFLITDEGEDYFRWEFTHVNQGIKFRQIFFFYESGDWKLMIAFTRVDDSGAEYDEIIDEVMKTVKYKR